MTESRMQLGQHLGCNLTRDVKLHPNFSWNFTLPAVALHPKFSGITPKCRDVSFQLQWSCTEIQSIRYAEEYGAIE